MTKHKVAFSERQRQKDVRMTNICAAKAIADAVRTSLGPRGMDKMIQDEHGEVIVTNDGATILKKMKLQQPAAKILQSLSRSQDIEAGDGTTSVVVLAGALLNAASRLLDRSIHPSRISEAFKLAVDKAEEILEEVGFPVNLDNREDLIACTKTSLSSKVVHIHSDIFAPLAVDAVLKIADKSKHTVDLDDIRIVKSIGGTIDETAMVDGLVLRNKLRMKGVDLPRIQNAKVCLIQFCVSPPKTDMDNNIVVSDYKAMDRLIREERKYIVNIIKKIKKSGCNVLLIQKSILRDAVNDLAMHYFSKAKIHVVTNIARNDVPHIARTLGLQPVAHVDHLKPEYLGKCDLVCQEDDIVKFTGCENGDKTTTSIIVRGTNRLIVDEADRSLHDALCVVRSIVKKRYLIAGGGSAEIEVSLKLAKWAQTLKGTHGFCVKAFADALEIIPYTLAENAGMHPTIIVTELRKLHSEGQHAAGINVKKNCISDMASDKVLQPLLVNTSALRLASESVIMILKIDDIVPILG